ncbi:hypothetical protein IGK38_000292 [Enterococcus pernyi]|uniref:hypothetical protein n=2 Tax=Enterococcus TaxID=1350 RepID=UPI000789BE92|nr:MULTISPECIES: hypothetical protein [Enterococcus]UBM05513.1 hypothetical protein K9N66_13840 [Enterococcus mundtii]
MKKKKIIPLLKISGNSSIYFDFEKSTPYVQHFKGAYTETAGKSYSKSRTFWTSQVLMVGMVTFGTILDRLLIFPVLVSLLLVWCLGYVLAHVFIGIMITNSLGEKEYRNFSPNEIQGVVSNSPKFWILLFVEFLLTIGILFVSIISIFDHMLKGEDFIELLFGVFSLASLRKIVPPILGIKAGGILKKQIKEGKFHDQ